MKLPRRLTLSAALLALALQVGCSLFVRPEVRPAPVESGDSTARRTGIVAIDSTKVPADLASPYWAKIRARETLVIGVNRRYPPFGLPAAPGSKREWVGFDVEVAEHLGHTLGVPIEIRGLASTEICDALASGEIDLALAGLTRTVERGAQVNFSKPYLVVSLGALIQRRFAEGTQGTDEEQRRNALKSYFDLAEIPGLRIGVAKNTRPQRSAANHFPDAKLVGYDDATAAADALAKGEINAVVHDAPFIRAWQVLNPSAGGRISALLESVTEEPICIAVRKGDLEFLRFLDVYVDEIRHDGTIKRYYQRHFVQTAWAKQSGVLGGAE